MASNAWSGDIITAVFGSIIVIIVFSLLSWRVRLWIRSRRGEDKPTFDMVPQRSSAEEEQVRESAETIAARYTLLPAPLWFSKSRTSGDPWN